MHLDDQAIVSAGPLRQLERGGLADEIEVVVGEDMQAQQAGRRLERFEAYVDSAPPIPAHRTAGAPRGAVSTPSATPSSSSASCSRTAAPAIVSTGGIVFFAVRIGVVNALCRFRLPSRPDDRRDQKQDAGRPGGDIRCRSRGNADARGSCRTDSDRRASSGTHRRSPDRRTRRATAIASALFSGVSSLGGAAAGCSGRSTASSR